MKIKRAISLLLATAMTVLCTMAAPLTASAANALPGDLNGDGLINTTDVVALRRHIAGGYQSAIDEAAADVNADGICNTTDVVTLRRYIAGGYDIELNPDEDTGNTDEIGVLSIELTSREGNLDTYTITFTNGQSTNFTIANDTDADEEEIGRAHV